MFAGHVGAGMAIARAETRLNAAAFVGAALLLDVVLWLFILLGWESVVIPADFARTHQAAFVFPWSHGLVASLAWSLLAGAACWMAGARLGARARWRAALLMAAAVFSHWVLDALVHRPELPLAGPDSPKLGLGLWDHMPVALLIEAGIALAGAAVLVRGRGWSRGRTLGTMALALLILGFTVAGMTVAPPPPSPRAMAGSSLATLVILVAFFGWLARTPGEPKG